MENVKYACELVEKRYKLREVPVEDAIPLFGLSSCLRLGKFSCFNPYKYDQWNEQEGEEELTEVTRSSIKLLRNDLEDDSKSRMMNKLTEALYLPNKIFSEKEK
jgi:hypothetical protein